MNVLVTGADSFLGLQLIAALRAAGHGVTALSLSEEPSRFADDPRVIWRAWPSRKDVFAKLLDECELVLAVDLAEPLSDADTLRDRRLFKLFAAIDASPGIRLVVLGSTEIYAPPKGVAGTLDEDAPLREPSELSATARLTLEVEARLAKSEMNWAVLRAPLILHPENPAALSFVRGILVEDAAAPGRFQPVESRDVIAALTAVARADTAEGMALNVAAPVAFSDRVLDQELGRLARILTNEAEADDALRPAHQPTVAVISTEALTDQTGFKPRHPIWPALSQTVQAVIRELGAEGLLEALPRKSGFVSRALELGETPLAGKVVVITGATRGVGRATTLLLGRLGATIAAVDSNARSGKALLQEVETGFNGVAGTFLEADLSSLEALRDVAMELSARHPKIDILIHSEDRRFNTRRETKEGLEMTVALHHIAPFLLSNLLAAPLQAADAARIVMVSSDEHRDATGAIAEEGAFQGTDAYAEAKFQNLQASYVMAQLLEESSVTVNAINPGEARPEAAGDGEIPDQPQQRATSVKESAMAIVTLASAPEFAGKTGLYLEMETIASSAPRTYDEDAAWQVWEDAARLTGLSAVQQNA
ncbi:NAD-dependent epimerase/dehydratase family protein [Dinoroseobacter sp. S375]|uniref:NAD-dependent epimerase/dehydratase family protein n=1 Tax=Dinoroseobacter sp. S375 TaxID=3415136 RepID=UPI003C7CDEA7